MTIFSLLAVFVGSIAWFTNYTNVDNTGQSVKMNFVGKFNKISYHSYSSVNEVSLGGGNTRIDYSFTKKPEAYIEYDWENHTVKQPRDGDNKLIPDGNFLIELNQYDPMHPYQPMMVLIELDAQYDTSASNEDVYVKAITDVDGFLGAKNAQKQPKYELGADCDLLVDTIDGVDYYPLSSVASFRAKCFSSSQFTTWDSGSTYDLTSLNTTVPVNHNFVTVDHDADISNFYESSEIYNSNHTDIVRYIAVIVDYNPSAIEYIYSTYLGDDTLEGTYDYILNFMCDWVWEIF